LQKPNLSILKNYRLDCRVSDANTQAQEPQEAPVDEQEASRMDNRYLETTLKPIPSSLHLLAPVSGAASLRDGARSLADTACVAR